jgi:uncharacterized protein involved in exopolysaccharide biosynthesis
MAEHGGRDSAEHIDRVDDGVDLPTVLRLLRRQWFVVVAVVAVFVAAAGAYAVFTPKTWRTSTRVMLDPRDKQIVGNELARAGNSELGWVETRLELVKAYGTLAEVVKRENLLTDPEVMGREEASPTPSAGSGDDPRITRAVRNLTEMVLVERPKENNLIDVTVTSRDPEKAARLSRAVAAAFVDGLARTKVEQIEQANTLLGGQVDQMRRKMLEAEARVEDYKRRNGIATTRGSLVDEETLRQANENLNTAHAKTQEARERFEQLRKAQRNGDLDGATQSDGVGSAVLARLKIDAAAAERRKTEVEQQFGPRHPRTRAAVSDLERARDLVRDELKSSVASAEIDYQIARANEDNVRRAYDRAQSRLADTGQATVALQELVNEANARRDLYRSFVARMEETNLQKNTQVSDATIVSPAQVPLKPFSPRVTLALALALVAGLGCGLSLALYRGRARLLRDLGPGDPAAATTAAPPRPVDPDPAATPTIGDHDARPAAAVAMPAPTEPQPEPPQPAAAAIATPTPPEPTPPEPATTTVPLAAVPAAEPTVAPVPPPVVAPVPPPIVADPAPAARPIVPPTAPIDAHEPPQTPPTAALPRPADPLVAATVETPAGDAPAPAEPEPAIAAPTVAAPLRPMARPTEPPPPAEPPRATASDRPHRVDLALLPERVARLGRRSGPGTGPEGALVETPEGGDDVDGLARLGRLGDALDGSEPAAVRLIFADTVPAPITAAIAHGLARAGVARGHRVLLVDLADDPAPLDGAFERATAAIPPEPLLDHPDFDLRVDSHGLLLARADPAAETEVIADLLLDAREGRDEVVVHLGSAPSAALIFDLAEVVDRIVMVAEAADLDGERLTREIDVMVGLLPRFDRILALSLSETGPSNRPEGRRRRRPTAERGEEAA